jgi:hypothetical protein
VPQFSLDLSADEHARDLRRDVVGLDDLGGEMAQAKSMTARRASQEREGLVDRQIEARRKDAFRLLDDDARVQRGLKLGAAAGD